MFPSEGDDAGGHVFRNERDVVEFGGINGGRVERHGIRFFFEAGDDDSADVKAGVEQGGEGLARKFAAGRHSEVEDGKVLHEVRQVIGKW